MMKKKERAEKNINGAKIALKIVPTILAILLVGALYWLTLPTLNPGYSSGYLFVSISIVIIVALVTIWLEIDDGFHTFLIIMASLLAMLLIFIIIAFFNSAIFHSSTMYSQIGEIEERSFTEDVLELDTSQIPVVDTSYAEKLADKKLGENASMGSQFRVGEFTNKQQIDGKLFYVAPLEYRGFFKWLNNDGTPGYVKVSATNPNDVTLVTNLDDKSLSLKYVNSAYFGKDLKRHIRFSGYARTGLTEFSFELDDEGNPFWVVTTYKNKLFCKCGEATGVVICDPQTGSINWYSVDDAPEWVDIIQPENFVESQLKNYGSLVHGAFNFSQKDELSVTEYMTTVYNDGDCYYYTGMSSAGEDESTVGFVMVNARTKAVKMYRMKGGATEAAAMESARGAAQNYGYWPTQPIPLNVSGIPTYFCTMKDDSGLVKTYAMICIENYSIVKMDDSLPALKRSYINAVSSSGQTIDFGDDTYSYSVTSTVTRITGNIEGGETVYYIVIDEEPTKIFTASYVVSDELPVTREGDEVTITYLNDNNGVINIVTFDNEAFTPDKSEKQEALDEEQKETNPINNTKNNKVTKVNPEDNDLKWDQLSDEEKARLLEALEDK